MRQHVLEIKDGARSFALEFSDRDFALLGGPTTFMELGAAYVQALGVFENTCVAMDMRIPPGSKVRRKRGHLRVLSESLLNLMERDADLLSFDYSFRLTGGEDRHRLKGHLSGFRIRSLLGTVSGQPRGFCTLSLSEVSPTGIGRVVEIIDLRNHKGIATDDQGLLKVYRTATDFGWPRALRSLIQFLESGTEEEVVIHHNEP